MKKFNEFINESLRDKMAPVSKENVNLSLDEYIKQLEDVLNSDPYDFDAFTAENFVDFISHFYGCKITGDERSNCL